MGFVSSDYGDEFILLEELFAELSAEEVRTASDIVGFDNFLTVTVIVVDRVRPHQIAEHS